MVQVYIKKRDLEEPIKLIVLEKLPAKDEEVEVVKVKAEEKPIKKALLKIMKKGKYNAKYLEERIPVADAKRKINFRNTGLF